MSDLEKLLDRRLDDFEWSVRTSNAMRNDGIETIRDLVRTTERQLSRIPNFGRKSLQEVKEFLIDRGLRLGMDLGPPKLRVAKIPPPRRLAPACVATVTVSALETSTRRFREEKTQRKGVPIDQCADDAAYFVEGRPLCLQHAGRAALDLIIREDSQRGR